MLAHLKIQYFDTFDQSGQKTRPNQPKYNNKDQMISKKSTEQPKGQNQTEWQSAMKWKHIYQNEDIREGFVVLKALVRYKKTSVTSFAKEGSLVSRTLSKFETRTFCNFSSNR